MIDFDINYMFKDDRKGEFYYDEHEFTKYMVPLIDGLLEENQIGFSLVDVYDMGIELFGEPKNNTFVPVLIRFSYILQEPDLDEFEDDEDGEESSEFWENNAEHEMFSIPIHKQFNLVNFNNFDFFQEENSLTKVGFQLYQDKSKGRGYKTYSLRPDFPSYFMS